MSILEGTDTVPLWIKLRRTRQCERIF